jgi:hypothetical protein
MAEWSARLTEGETDMNVQETTGTTTELGIRELTATELDHVSGGGCWLIDFIVATWTLAVLGCNEGYRC